MRLLSRYVLKEFLTPVGYCFFAFASLHLIFELFGEADKIFQAKPPFLLVLRYIGGFLSKDIQWLITPSLLLGGLYAMWQLARHSEITAMRASGIGFKMITSPMLGAAIAFSIGLFLISEFYAPRAIFESNMINASSFKHGTGSEILDVPFNNLVDRREWQIGKIDTGDKTFHSVKVTTTDDDGHRIKVLEAPMAYHQNNVWWFEDAVVSLYQPSDFSMGQMPTEVYERPLLVVPEFSEAPRDFLIEQNVQGVNPLVETLSVRDMHRYLKSHPNLAPLTRRTWMYEMVNRFVAPLACFFITLFAIPAGVATGRQSVFAGVVMAIMLFIGYYAVTLFCGVQAKSGWMPIWLGVTLPNVMIFLSGLYLFHKQR